MERYETTMRAARYLLGAGMIAVAMVATTARPASAETTECLGEPPYVCGHVFTETDSPSNGYQTGEGTPNITVELIHKSTNSTVTTTSNAVGCPGTDDCGYYYFDAPETPGDYKVCVTAADGTRTCKDVTQQIVDVPLGTGRPYDADGPYEHYDQGLGTGTPGYWKNHPESWPDDGVKIGGTQYSVEAAIALMRKVSGDKTYSMFSALVAAKLNTMPSLNNDYACVAGTIFDADAWMTVHPVGGPTPVKASSVAWQQAEDWHQRLDDFNNGKLCAHHRD